MYAHCSHSPGLLITVSREVHNTRATEQVKHGGHSDKGACCAGSQALDEDDAGVFCHSRIYRAAEHAEHVASSTSSTSW